MIRRTTCSSPRLPIGAKAASRRPRSVPEARGLLTTPDASDAISGAPWRVPGLWAGTAGARPSSAARRRCTGVGAMSAGKSKARITPEVTKPASLPVRTAEEQALVDAWQSRPRLQRAPRLKEGEAPGTVVPDTADEPLWSARMEKALGVDDPWMAKALMNQAANCVGGSPAEAPNVALASIHSIGPRDGVEAMLAVQMTATHAAAMQMLYRAMREQPSFEIYDSIVNRATKLLRTYTAQIEALKRYRSAGEQRVVVQHQHVNVTADQAAVQVNGVAPAPGGRGASE